MNRLMRIANTDSLDKKISRPVLDCKHIYFWIANRFQANIQSENNLPRQYQEDEEK